MVAGVHRLTYVKTYILMFSLTVVPMMAQTKLLTLGVEGGVPTQTPIGQSATQVPFVLGPKVDIRISPRLSVETGVLFHRMGQQSNTGVFLYPENSVTLVSGTVRGRALEVPLLAKYYFVGEHRTWRPFIAGGPAIRRTALDDGQFSSIVSGTAFVTLGSQPFLNTKVVKWNVDPSFGAGIDFKTGRFHIEPKVAYSYWGAGTNTAVRKNQVGFELGFRF